MGAHSRLSLRPWLWSVCVLAVGCGTWVLGAQWPLRQWGLIAAFGALQLLSSTVSFELPSRLTVTPSAVTVMAAVAALSTRDRFAGAMLVVVFEALELKRLRARRYLIVGFNAAQLALASLASAAVYQALEGSNVVLLVAATATTYMACNAALVVPAGALAEPGPLRRVLPDLRNFALTEPPFAVVGLLIGQAYRHHGAVVLVLVASAVLVARTVMASMARFRHAFERLESIYEFTRELDAAGASGGEGQVLGSLGSRLGVRAVEVVLADAHGWRRSTWSEERGHSRTGRRDGEPEGPAAAVPTLASELPPDAPLALRMAERGMGDGMVVPLLADGRRIGEVRAAGTPNQRSLGVEDLRLLETFANHLASWLERARLDEQLRHDADHDQLTGLPNRRRFTELLAAAPRPSTVLLVDLDRFKEVNDTLGHDHGDLLLRGVAARLVGQFPGGVVARLGGDEFGVLLRGVAAGDATGAAVGLLGALEHPFPIGVLDLEVTGSVGVAVAEDDTDADRLLGQADVAMYAAKEAHSGWEVYSPTRFHHSPWQLSLASDLRRGLGAGELEVHYQPKARVGDAAVVGVEALVRWRHPRYGLLSPDQFVHVAEQAGLIRPLTLEVLSEACAQHTRLAELGFPLGIAVNLSVRSVLDVNLPDQVAAVLADHGVDAGRLTLEITEGSLMADPARTIGVLGRLAALGIHISIDDFGTGYSSLGYLKRLPATEVKIDRSFVSNLLSSTSDEAIVRSTIDLAHNLGLRAVAEGIEDPETWSALARMGCDEGQGYFLSAPLAAGALLPWLLRDRSSDLHG